MSDMYNIWRGRLFVGPEDLGSATMWTSKSIYIPAIGGNLRMTAVGEYKDLWEKIIGTEPFDMSVGSKDVNGRNVSIFTLLAHSPHFCDLTKEMTSTPHPRVLTAEIYNPYVHIRVVLVPQCKEVEDLGLTEMDQKQPHLHAIFVSSVNVPMSMAVYSYQRSIALLKMKNKSAEEKYSPWKVYGLQVEDKKIDVHQRKLDAQNEESSKCNISPHVHEQNCENMQNLPVKNSEISDAVVSSLDGNMTEKSAFPSEIQKKMSDGCRTRADANIISQDQHEKPVNHTDSSVSGAEKPVNHTDSSVSGARALEIDGQALSSTSHADKDTSASLSGDAFVPTTAGIKNVVSLVTKLVSLEKNSCCRFENNPGECQHDETDVIKKIDELLVKKIQNLHSLDEDQKQKVSKGSTSDKKGKFLEKLLSSYTVKGSDPSQVYVKSEILELDDCSPIDKRTVLFTPLEGFQIDWESEKFPIRTPSCGPDVRRVHLLDANTDDIMKLKMPVMKKSNRLSYCSINDIFKLDGCVYVRPDKVKDLLESPNLWQLSHKHTARFAVCISLTDIVNDVGRPLLMSKCLLLVHHTAFVDSALGRILERVIEDRNKNINHHHKVLISKATLKLCILSLHCSKRVTPKEDQIFSNVLRNLHSLTRCLKVCAVQIIDGGPWKTLGGTSPLKDYLHCLKVAHHCLKYAHRHSAVLVGERNWAAKTANKEFYKIATTSSIISEILM